MKATADALMGIFGFKRVEGDGMKSDRELLELAALAWIRSGMRLECPDDEDGIYVCRDKFRNGHTWNPLTDDGDLARLEAALEIDVSWISKTVTSQRLSGAVICSVSESFSVHGNDRQKARRYASVRVAAAIGEGMV